MIPHAGVPRATVGEGFLPLKIHRASAQGVSDHEKLSFDIDPFHFFDFFDCNQLKQEFGHQFEQQFELELNSNKNSSSSYCFCSRSAHARRRLWEPLDIAIVQDFQLLRGASFFEAMSGAFFLRNGAKWNLKWPQKTHKI